MSETKNKGRHYMNDKKIEQRVPVDDWNCSSEEDKEMEHAALGVSAFESRWNI
jgi:hypothetical protein